MTADEDWQVDRLREDGDPNHDSDIQRAVDKANKVREQGADVVATANVHQGNYQWCPISSDPPIGTCWDEAYDAQIRQRIWDVIYSMGADQNVVKEWNITQEQAAKQ